MLNLSGVRYRGGWKLDRLCFVCLLQYKVPKDSLVLFSRKFPVIRNIGGLPWNALVTIFLPARTPLYWNEFSHLLLVTAINMYVHIHVWQPSHAFVYVWDRTHVDLGYAPILPKNRVIWVVRVYIQQKFVYTVYSCEMTVGPSCWFVEAPRRSVECFLCTS